MEKKTAEQGMDEGIAHYKQGHTSLTHPMPNFKKIWTIHWTT